MCTGAAGAGGAAAAAATNGAAASGGTRAQLFLLPILDNRRAGSFGMVALVEPWNERWKKGGTKGGTKAQCLNATLTVSVITRKMPLAPLPA
jgi:hypothetical protein